MAAGKIPMNANISGESLKSEPKQDSSIVSKISSKTLLTPEGKIT